jgi:hypothetical protein
MILTGWFAHLRLGYFTQACDPQPLVVAAPQQFLTQAGGFVFTHNKDLQFEVRVSEPDPRFATVLMEQFGGANGELTGLRACFALGEGGYERVGPGRCDCRSGSRFCHE